MAKVQNTSNKKGKKTGVYLSYTKYNRLIEDLHDLREVAKRKYEKPVSARELKNRLKKKGLV
jgi:hypothetical protein